MEEERKGRPCVGSFGIASRSSGRRKETGAPRSSFLPSLLPSFVRPFLPIQPGYISHALPGPFVRLSASRSITRQARRSSSCTAAVSHDGKRTRTGSRWMSPSARYRKRAIRGVGRRRVRCPLFPFRPFVKLTMGIGNLSKRPLGPLTAYRHLEYPAPNPHPYVPPFAIRNAPTRQAHPDDARHSADLYPTENTHPHAK